MAAIHKALDECSAEHPVFYEDEVDIHLNPKIGADWQLRGQQKTRGDAEAERKILSGWRTALRNWQSQLRGRQQQKFGGVHQPAEAA